MKVSWDKKTVVELAELLEDIISRVELLEGKYVAQVESGSALKPQPVATLCEEVSRFLGTIHDWHTINLGKARLQEALTAERKRAELVENLIDAARRFYQENDGRYDLLRARLSELDAFDKGAENG